MNNFYASFIQMAKDLADQKQLCWVLPCDALGKIAKDKRWNLTRLCGMVPPPTIWLSDLGYDHNCLPALNRISEEQNGGVIGDRAMSHHWQEFYQAVVLNELLIKRNKPGHAITNVGRHIKILAACAGDTEPWSLTPDIVQRAYNAALLMGESGKIAANLAMVIRIVIDGLHLTDHNPISCFCVPYTTDSAKLAEKQVKTLKVSNNAHRRVDKLRVELSQRKRSEKLPDERAFWELVRIVFTEKPKTVADAVRFFQVKLALVTGFRAGETATLPVDWERWREYVDQNGHPAGKRGGISRSLMIRHFAEKQADDEGSRKDESGAQGQSIVLYETAQHVPPMFEDLVIESLSTVQRITQPMRDNLKRQTETGRLFPEFAPEDLVTGWELRTRCTGAINQAKSPVPEYLISAYRTTLDPEILEQIRSQQIECLHRDGVNVSVGQFWSRHRKQHGLTIRHSTGVPYLMNERVPQDDLFLKVGEVEELFGRILPTKKSDMAPFVLQDGAMLYPHELMFLLPIADRIESLDHGVLDISNYFAIGRTSPQELFYQLGGLPDNLFSRYGETETDRQLSLNPHALRHLQNGELFRLGVADTIITKRFNRRSVAQSYEYDHTSLAENLANIALPEAAEVMGPKAQEVLKMIRSGQVAGPVVDEFKKIQASLGDEAAFDYLDAEADGLHVTPYGFCINSFTVDPCPKHIECYNGCQHLCRSHVAEEQHNLEEISLRMQRVVTKIQSTPSEQRTPGWKNQLEHAEIRLRNIEKALATKPGGQPFPDGPDLYRSFDDKAGTTILDRPKGQRAE